ncbi:aminodeoxychorismate synthase component 1 [Rosenbergiella australiborealis]|uniref:aminodeoxychorismate synthase n=1 Tax=Rosenbergiella australiborealis TaxID=1544696 RepID=A0ABS5T1U0_9GAMM|nr:aminodeoxychorismate synthase component 1 [Rosenbergiella australiborealis]MBT0726294.1 aminodeoxychorismate synthase component 1 [Rosenbergiella australiborealis]
MSPESISLSYHQAAIETWFSRIAHLPWAMLLSSSQASHPDARYDILTADPLSTLVTYGRETFLQTGDHITCSNDDPMTLIERALSLLPRVTTPSSPFSGGAVGLWGYDLGRRFETLPEQAVSDLDCPDMAVGIYDWALIADHHLKTLTLISLSDANTRLDWLHSQKRRETVNFSLTSAWQSNLDAQAYRQKFEQVQAYILAGDCYQINLAQRFKASYQGCEWQAYQQLSQSNRAPFSAFLRLPNSTILSFSPERFIKVEEKVIETKPIKGTVPRDPDPKRDQLQREWLANSIKNRAENLMIVDLLRNDIGRIASPGSVNVPALFAIETFPAVHHLVSTVRGILPDSVAVTQLLRACFPGGSITGAPKIRAMEIIDELEPHRRNAWCGSIGFISRCGNMDTSITIRTLIAEKQTLYCSAGGGIVADSQWEEEYQETFHKVSKILPILSKLGQADE